MRSDRSAPATAAALTVRSMGQADLDDAVALSASAFSIELGDELDARRWRERVAHTLATDPGGAFVAELDGRVTGVAAAIRRERLWCLSLLAVAPELQSAGAGTALMQHALAYGAGAPAGLIVSSNDPRALRLYALHGFSLLPTFDAEGMLDRSALPRERAHVTEVDVASLEQLAEISREVRGGPHTRELEFVQSRGGRILRLRDRGFAVFESGRVWLLVARDDEAARALLWEALEHAAGAAPTHVRWITGAQQWAISVLLHAGLRLTAHGALAVRGNPGSLRPYLPSAPFA